MNFMFCRQIFVLFSFLLFCSCIESNFENTINYLNGLSAKEFRSQVCKSLDKNGGLLRCAPANPKDNLKMAFEYIKSKGRPDPSSLSPVVILPGLAGSAMQAKLQAHVAPHWWCFSNWDEWFRLWLPIQELLAQDCWFDNLQVIYNATTNEYDSPIGVTVDTMDFGGTSGIDYLDYWFGFPIPFTTYYSSFLASLEAVGYQKGVNLFGAPFDWRVPTSIHELDESRFNQRFLSLIEDIATKTGKKVDIVTHSMGGHVAIEFFNTMNQTWLDKYINKFIPIAAPWSGSPKVLRTVLSGDNFGIEVLGVSLLNTQKVKELARSGGGLIELLPFAAYYDAKTIFVQQNNKTYTAKDFFELFQDANTPITATIYKKTLRVLEDLRVPRVDSYCIYGDGVPTEIFYNYTNGFDAEPEITWSQQGDGTVPIESLKMCGEWAQKQSQPVISKQFDLVGHSDILHDPDVFAYIISLLQS